MSGTHAKSYKTLELFRTDTSRSVVSVMKLNISIECATTRGKIFYLMSINMQVVTPSEASWLNWAWLAIELIANTKPLYILHGSDIPQRKNPVMYSKQGFIQDFWLGGGGGGGGGGNPSFPPLYETLVNTIKKNNAEVTFDLSILN